MTTPIRFDRNCYWIENRPTWLLSGEMHYFKTTRGDWRRRLLQLKCAGFNTVSVYMPWNYHELGEGDWDFTGDRDVEHFLQLAAELGLYVVARPGPYICDEWQAGGLPVWLSGKPGIRLRTRDPEFLAHVDKWWDRIAPLIARYELGREGTVILAQVENEYGHYGEGQEAEYIHHLRDGLRARGVSVPIINCDSFINFARLKPRVYEGVNLCCNFGGDGLRNLARARGLQPDAPLFVTEYWIAAFDWWGRHGSAVYDDARALNGALEIAAGGAGGLTAFVFAGGAHFGYWHGRSICSDANFMTTLYGPGAPILDDGRFSGKYDLFKTRLAPLNLPALARAGMPEIVELQPGLIQATRRGPDGTFVFTLNRSAEQIRIADAEKDQACVDMSIPAGAVRWTVRDLRLPGGQRLDRTSLDLLATEPALILFGEAGSEGWVELDGTRLDVHVPGGSLPVHLRHDEVDILVLNRAAAGRCWPLALPGAPAVVFGGPERIEDAVVGKGWIDIAASSPSQAEVWRFHDGRLTVESPAYVEASAPDAVALTRIRFGRGLPERAADFDDSAWFGAAQPRRMAAFGHGHGYAWYRANFEVVDDGPQTIVFSGADDRAHVWVDGHYLGCRGWGSSHGWHLMPNLLAGIHTLAVLVENLGMFNSGAEYDIPLGEPKGLYGPVWLNGVEIPGWRMRAGLGAGEGIDRWERPGGDLDEPSPDGATLAGPLWVAGEFAVPEGFDGAVRLELGEHAGKGSVWLNGRNVGRYWNLGPQQSLWLPPSWLKPRNDLVLFEEARIAPDRLRVALTSFGPRWCASIELPRAKGGQSRFGQLGGCFDSANVVQ
ncbi:MAG: beta-galactosidase [Kiritimatiellia bacterium]|jgi:beta-galactosidase